MKSLFLAAVVGIVLWSHPVCAEMYRYKDAGGVIRFTDNLADVPVKQRTGVSIYDNSPSPIAPSAIEQPSSLNSWGGQNLKMPEITKTSPGVIVMTFDQVLLKIEAGTGVYGTG